MLMDRKAKTTTPGSPLERPSAAGRSNLRRYAFVLLPGFSSLSLQAMWEPLQWAHSYVAVERHRNWLVSLDGRAVPTNSGIRQAVDCSLDDLAEVDAVVIIGGEDLQEPLAERLKSWLYHCRSQGWMIGAVDYGVVAMAQMGLLDGYSVTANLRYRHYLTEAFPHLSIENSLFEIDRDRFTCAGGVAGLDLVLEMIATDMGGDVADICLNHFNQDRRRAGHEPQRLPFEQGVNSASRKLKRAMAIIQDNLEEELTSDELADLVGSSRRQLERLFRRFLGKSPMAYRQELRLWRGRDLVLSTPMSITQVAFASGFSSNSHFSSRFKLLFGMSPREARLSGKRQPPMIRTIESGSSASL